MFRGFAVLIVLASCVATPPDEDITGDATPVVSEPTPVNIATMHPEPDSDGFFFEDRPFVLFDAPASNVSLELDGISATLLQDGNLYTLVPDEPLSPSTDYDFTVSWEPSSDSPVTASFSTSSFGSPVGDPSGLVGGTWRLDAGSGEFVQPPAIGPILQSQFTEAGIFLGIDDASDLAAGTASLQIAAAEGSSDDIQAPCELSHPWTAGLDAVVGTADDTPAAWDDPFLSFGPQDAMIPLQGTLALIADLEWRAVVHPEGAGVAGVDLSGRVDTRTFDVALDPEGNLGAVCELVQKTIGVECVECGGDDPGPYCLDMEVVGMTATRIDGLSLETLRCEDIIDRYVAGTCSLSDVEAWDVDGDGIYEGCEAWTP